MPLSLPADYAERLRRLRKALGLSQAQLAARLGVSPASLKRWERGSAHPSALAWRQLTRLDADADDAVGAGRGPASVVPRSGPGALPVALSSFIGRVRERAAVADLLTLSRLVTLTGTGGAGKTRLAMQVVAERAPGYYDGVRFVDLSGVADPALLLPSVAATLGVQEQRGQPLSERLVAALAPCELLVVLDNCEHLLESCAELALLLLRGCPDLRLLATSREPLGVEGERVWRVPPLALPADGTAATPEVLAGSDAVQLFSERARAVEPAFALTEANAAALAALCRRLDGLPLALELAAARVSVVSVEQILDRLDDRFRLLVSGRRGTPARHQTLQAAIAWSYELLRERERALFERLAVFAGSFALEAAEAVATTGEPVMALLTALVEQSLVVKEEAIGEARYRLLETLRAFGRERLLERGTAQEALCRHAEYYAALAEKAGPHLMGAELQYWLHRLDLELANSRAALAWSIEARQDGLALRLGGMPWRYWQARGYLSEGRLWLERALACGSAAPVTVRATALNTLGILAANQGDLRTAHTRYEEALALWTELGDRRWTALVRINLGIVSADEDEYDQARALYEQALDAVRAVGDEWHTALVLNNLGDLCDREAKYGEAQAYLRNSLELWRKLSDERGIAMVLDNLGHVARCLGKTVEARALHEESLALQRQWSDRHDIVYTISNLGLVARDEGDPTTAMALHEESLAICRERGDRAGVARALHNLGLVALDLSDYGRASRALRESLEINRSLDGKVRVAESLEGLARLLRLATDAWSVAVLALAAAAGVRDRIGAPLAPADRVAWERDVATVRRHLGERGFAAAWAGGAAMSLQAVIALVLETLTESAGAFAARAVQAVPSGDASRPAGRGPVAAHGGRVRRGPGHPDALTERERSVLRLLSQGHSHKEIAVALTLSVRTVEHHLTSIYAKTGTRGKGDAIAYAHRQGLA